jgi:hypothetical protein
MSKIKFIENLNEETLDRIDRERTETMSKKEFTQWCKELGVSASYVDRKLHGDNSNDMMDMINRDRWIATFARYNKLTN